jgi:CRP/FNR family transcriptional regulator, cyclic AMP receptor protein
MNSLAYPMWNAQATPGLHRQRAVLHSGLDTHPTPPPTMSTSHSASTQPKAEPSEHAKALAELGVRRRYAKGVLLMQEGDFGDIIYVLQRGRCKVFATDDDQREIIYGYIEPGEYFGEMSLDGGKRSANVITLEECECAVVTQATLRQYTLENPQFAFELIDRVIARARAATQAVRDMALLDVYGRLARQLETMAPSTPDAAGERAISENVTQQELANRVGSSREMVSRIIKELERGGYLALRQRHIVLLKKLPARF